MNDKVKNKIINFVLDMAKTHIIDEFDKNDKYDKTFLFKNNNHEIIIHRSCFHSGNSESSYVEDYRIHFTGIMQDKRLTSSFYLEWKDNKLGSELIPANTQWDPVTRIFSNRNIKIKVECVESVESVESVNIFDIVEGIY
jgi:hypothetical protein